MNNNLQINPGFIKAIVVATACLLLVLQLAKP